MNKILVTGATGFIGSYLVNYLIQHNYSVRVLVRQPVKQLSAEVEQFIGDLTQPDTLKNCCDQISTIYHLAGFAHAFKEGDLSFADKHNTINFLGTMNLFAQAKASGVQQFVYFSSVKAVADSKQCIDEQWQHLPDSPYGLAKRKSEEFLLHAGAQQNMHISILRPALVYGPHFKGNLFAMLRAIDKNYFIPVPAIKNRRSMISLADICQAAVLCANHPAAKGKIYFVTDGRDYSTRELYLAMREALGRPAPGWHLPLAGFKLLGRAGDIAQKIFRTRLPFNTESLGKLFDSAAYNSQLIQKELGFKPDYDLKKCLPDIIAAYKQSKSVIIANP
jgi:UDP-glucose 4-epimerase